MSQNLLPFDPKELARFGLSWSHLRLLTLARTQKRTMRNAAGVIFLTRAASNIVQKAIGTLDCPSEIIPHGISPAFAQVPRRQLPIDTFSVDRPFRWLYVSMVHHYKHQWHVVRAAAHIRALGFPIRLDLVGPAYRPALQRLQRVIGEHDPHGEFVTYHGQVAYESLPVFYKEADAFVFASTCENMPIILLESMGAGLPVVCSRHPVMQEVLKNAGVFVDPESADSIAAGMLEVMGDSALRSVMA
jgi:glycosyltransferase involved in cell wall biosynthesis